MTTIGAIRGPVEIFTRASDAMDQLVKTISAAEYGVTGEVFMLNDRPVVDLLLSKAASSNGDARAAVTLLADPEVFAKKSSAALKAELIAGGVNLIEFGSMPRKVHSKLFTIDADGGGGAARSWLSSSPIIRHNYPVLDFTAVFGGVASESAASLTRGAIMESKAGQRVLAAEAARHGVLLNDRYAGIHTLRDAWNLLIKDAKNAGSDGELVIATKSFMDEKFAQSIAEAHQAGVDMTLVTQRTKMSKGVARILKENNISYTNDEIGFIHGNVVISNGQRAVFGSAHLTERAMARKDAYRSSRETGVMIDGAEDVAVIRSDVLAAARNLDAI